MSPQQCILVDGQIVPVDDEAAWHSWMGRLANRQVCHTSLGHGRFVSTVFLGLDLCEGDGPPAYFSTLIAGLPDPGKEGALYVWAASDIEGAQEQHDQAVVIARSILDA